MEITVQDLKNKFNLTLTEDETGIYVYPMNRYCFTSFPLPKDLSVIQKYYAALDAYCNEL